MLISLRKYVSDSKLLDQLSFPTAEQSELYQSTNIPVFSSRSYKTKKMQSMKHNKPERIKAG